MTITSKSDLRLRLLAFRCAKILKGVPTTMSGFSIKSGFSREMSPSKETSILLISLEHFTVRSATAEFIYKKITFQIFDILIIHTE